MQDMTQGIIFYTGKERIGKYYLSRLCFMRKQQHQLPDETIEETFRYGRVEEVIREKYEVKYKIAYAYDDRVVYAIYTRDWTQGGVWRGNLNEVWFVLVTCWVQRTR